MGNQAGSVSRRTGLYAIGMPNNRSDVLVTAITSLTFDTVRKNLNGLNVWLLVLDTKESTFGVSRKR